MQQKLTDTSVFWAGWIQLYSALSGMEFLQDRKCFFVYLVPSKGLVLELVLEVRWHEGGKEGGSVVVPACLTSGLIQKLGR